MLYPIIKDYLRLCFLFIVVSACKTSDDRTKDLSAAVDSVIAAVPDFSGVVLIAEDGKPMFHKAYGYKNFNDSTPMDTGAIFELASLSKQFTAMAIMILKQDRKLDYDDALEKYIPGLPYPGISIRHLLNHTSGLPDYQAIMDKYWDKSKIAGNDDNIEYLKKYRPAAVFPPGEKYQYSNTGYMLLATIAEKASGKDFIEFCRGRIFSPAGMTSTDIRTKSDKMKLDNMAWGFIFVPERKTFVSADSFPAFNYAIWLGNREGPGRVSSTTTDLLKWDQILYRDALVSQTELAEAFTPATLNNKSKSNYGFGWSINEDSGVLTVFHTGDNPGYKTIIIREIQKKRCLILLNNNAHQQFETLVRKISGLLELKPAHFD